MRKNIDDFFMMQELFGLFVCLFVIFRNTQQFSGDMMAVSFYWWEREPRYIIQCI
jgi:hypothetical protein